MKGGHGLSEVQGLSRGRYLKEHAGLDWRENKGKKPPLLVFDVENR